MIDAYQRADEEINLPIHARLVPYAEIWSFKKQDCLRATDTIPTFALGYLDCMLKKQDKALSAKARKYSCGSYFERGNRLS